jgi:hypothetical protein
MITRDSRKNRDFQKTGISRKQGFPENRDFHNP